MKGILKTLFVNLLILYIVCQMFQGIVFKKGPETFLVAGALLAVSSITVKPLINIMILPINLVTFGLFRWFSSAATLYVITLVLPDFLINQFFYGGYTSMWFDIPSVKFHGIFAIIAYSFTMSILNTILHWLLK